jgi:hypothetical protein
MNCPGCGSPVEKEAQFCSRISHSLDELPPEIRAALEQPNAWQKGE